MSKITNIIVLLCIGINIYASDSIEDSLFVNYDSIEVSKQTDNNAQAGIKEFELHNYTKAIYFLTKSFNKNRNEDIADYLYGSYIQMNKIDLAKSIFPFLSEDNKILYEIKPKYISSVYVEGGMLNNKASVEDDKDVYNTYQPGGYGMIEIKHDITSNLSYSHLFNFYQINGIQHNSMQNYDGTSIKENKIKDQHFSYAGSIKYILPKQWVIGLSGVYFRDKSVYYSYANATITTDNNQDSYDDFFSDGYYNTDGQLYTDNYFKRGYINDGQNYNDIYNLYNDSVTIREENIINNNFGFEISLKKDFGLITPAIFCSYSRISNENIYQPKIQLTVYPFQNLSLYSTTTVSDVISGAKSQFIIEELAGARFTDWMWLELAFEYGNLKNYNENDFTTIYSLIGKTKYRLSANLIIPLNNRFMFNVLYRYMPTEMEFDDANYIQTNKSHNLIAGVKCSF